MVQSAASIRALTAYERAARAEIRAFKEPIAGIVQFLAALTHDEAPTTVRTLAALREISDTLRDPRSFRVRRVADDGLAVAPAVAPDLATLEGGDDVAACLRNKQKSLGAALAALEATNPNQIVTRLFVAAQRAVCEFAACYGFDTAELNERKFAIALLRAASAPSDVSRWAELCYLSQRLDPTGIATPLRQQELGELVAEVAQTLAIRLTRYTLRDAVPTAGVALGADVNVWYLANTAEMAFALYRERFLIRKYGPAVAVATSQHD